MTNSLASDWILFIQYSDNECQKLLEEKNSSCMIFHLMWLCKMTTDIITITWNKGSWQNAGVHLRILVNYPADRDGCYWYSQLSNSVFTFSNFKKPLLYMMRLVTNTFKFICSTNVSISSSNLIMTTFHVEIKDFVDFRYSETCVRIYILILI